MVDISFEWKRTSFTHRTVLERRLVTIKVRGHRSNFLDSLSQPFEIGPSDLRMTPDAFRAIKLLMATYTDLDIQKKVGVVVFIVSL